MKGFQDHTITDELRDKSSGGDVSSPVTGHPSRLTYPRPFALVYPNPTPGLQIWGRIPKGKGKGRILI